MFSVDTPFLTNISKNKNTQGRFPVLNGMKPGHMGKTVPKPETQSIVPVVFE